MFITVDLVKRNFKVVSNRIKNSILPQKEKNEYLEILEGINMTVDILDYALNINAENNEEFGELNVIEISNELFEINQALVEIGSKV